MQDLCQFYTVVVIEYFSRPLTGEEAESIKNKYASLRIPFLTPERLVSMPHGSILGRYIDNFELNDVRVFYPFFPHMNMPVKPGEQVFALNDDRKGFWVTRKASDLVAEDINYTHNDRSNYSANFINTEMTKGIINKPAQLFPDAGQAGISYSTVVENSQTIKTEFQGEAVPRYPVHNADFSLQGSNNSLIVLGSSATLGSKSIKSGMIDIVAGRGQGVLTKPTSEFQNARSYTEVDKTAKLNPDEGNLDLASDLSRIHVSMNMDPDRAFGITLPANTNKSGPAPSIVNKTNKYRVISRNDASILVEGENGCSVILNDDGNIYVNPGTSGKVFLNGPNSNQPYLKYDEFKDIVNRLIDMVAALQSTISFVSLAASSAAAGGPSAIALAIEAASQEDPGTIAIDSYVQQVNSLLESIKSKKILGS